MRVNTVDKIVNIQILVIIVIVLSLLIYDIYSSTSDDLSRKEQCEKFGGKLADAMREEVCIKNGKVYDFIKVETDDGRRYRLYVRGGDNHD